jgi:hypothetical protein
MLISDVGNLLILVRILQHLTTPPDIITAKKLAPEVRRPACNLPEHAS